MWPERGRPRCGPGRWRRAGALAGVLLLLMFASVPPAAASSGAAAGAEVGDITRSLRCPVCENLSVADSPTALAEQMRAVVRQKVDAGESREQILAYFVERYGEGVLVAPPRQGFGQVLWWGPVVMLAGGAALVGAALGGRRRASAGRRRAQPLSPEEEHAYAAWLAGRAGGGAEDAP